MVLFFLTQVSWTHALRQIVINCYKYHNREDLLPVFSGEPTPDEVEMKPNIKLIQQKGGVGVSTVVQGQEQQGESTNNQQQSQHVTIVSSSDQQIGQQVQISNEKMYSICEFLKSQPVGLNEKV